jgi:hypothetical protein
MNAYDHRRATAAIVGRVKAFHKIDFLVGKIVHRFNAFPVWIVRFQMHVGIDLEQPF